MVTTPEQIAAGGQAGVTIGNFDGVHRGHQKLIKRTLEVCRTQGLDCIVVTFWPHPRAVLSEKALPPLADKQTRRQLLGELGVQYLLELSFTKEMAALSPSEFLEQYLYPLNLKQLVIGYDFHLGKSRSGDLEVLSKIGEQDGFKVEQVSPLMLGNEPISSTRLRKVIEAGEMELATRMLGHFHGFSGMVVHGDGRGKGLGYPTANLNVPSVLLPPDGVYATCVRHHGDSYLAVTNIGYRPTFEGHKRTIESFLLNNNCNLYDEEIRLDFLGRLRDERRFHSSVALTEQIGRDIEKAQILYTTVQL